MTTYICCRAEKRDKKLAKVSLYASFLCKPSVYEDEPFHVHDELSSAFIQTSEFIEKVAQPWKFH